MTGLDASVLLFSIFFFFFLVKVRVWFSELNALLTKKFPKFFSPLNEISCGKKICV